MIEWKSHFRESLMFYTLAPFASTVAPFFIFYEWRFSANDSFLFASFGADQLLVFITDQT